MCVHTSGSFSFHFLCLGHMGGASSVSSPGGAQHTVHGDRKDDNGTILQTPNQTAVDLAKVNAFVKESFTSTMMKRGREDTVTRFVASPAARQAFKSFLLHEFSDSDGRLQEFLKVLTHFNIILIVAMAQLASPCVASPFPFSSFFVLKNRISMIMPFRCALLRAKITPRI